MKSSEFLKGLGGKSYVRVIIMTKDGEIATLSIPDHKEVAKGTLKSLIRAANLTVDEFVKAK